MTTFSFKTVEKQNSLGSRSYKGASVNPSGIYISKVTAEEHGLEEWDSVHLEVDQVNNAFQMERGENGDWALNEQPSAGVSFGSTGKIGFHQRIGLPQGRYQLAERVNDTLVFTYQG